MKTLFLCLALLAAVSSSRAAGPCADDAAAACPKTKDWQDRVKCLEQHQDKLSPACKTHLAEMKSRGDAFRDDCKADIGGACLNLQGHALMECLETQGDKLSKPCADRLAAMRAGHRAERERIAAECKDDAQKACAGVAAGGVRDCLRKNEAKLSKECRGALK